MATVQVVRFKCDICNIDFDSKEALTDHNIQQPPGTTPDAVQPDLNHGDSK
jgi:hypothetical protein